MPSEVIRYVDPNSSGGDGTTNELSGVNAAYASLGTALTTEQKDLTASDEIYRFICSSNQDLGGGSPDTAVARVNTNWVTDATRYVSIEAASSHGGKWNDNIYRMVSSVSGTEFAVLIVYTDYCYITGIQIKINYAGTAQLHGVDFDTGTELYLDKLILMATAASTEFSYGIYGRSTAGTMRVTNSIIYDFDSVSPESFGIRAEVGGCTYYNLTFDNCVYAFVQTGSASNAYNVGMVNCTSSDAGNVNYTTSSTTTPTFVDYANDDFHLDASDTTWRGQGTDESGVFTDDIDGETRSGSWDIGADQYVAGGAEHILTGKILLEVRTDGTT